MATINKPFSRLIKSVVFVLAMAIVLCGLQPVTLAQTKTTPGGLTITWYSAKRLVYSDTETKKSSDGRLLNSMLNQAMNVGAKTTVAIDTAKSNQAYNSQDRSVRLGSEPINELSFDLTKWMPALAIPPAMELRDKYVWGEVTGYIRMPRTGYLIINQINDTPADFVFETMGTDYGQWTNVNDPSDRRIVQNEAADKWVFEEGTMIPFRMCIGNIGMDPSDPDQKFKLKLVTFIGMEDKGEPVGMDAFYANVGLDQMKESFFFNPKDFTLRFDSANVNFPVDSYEYGIYNGVLTTSMVHKASGFQTLHLGINHLTPDSGTIIVRSKDQFTGPYIELGIASLAPPQKVALTRRTSTAAYLSWEVPDQEVPEGYKIKYDIYRRYIGELADQSFLPTESGGEFGKVGSTTSLTYTDQGLDPNALYEYYVIAGYPTGFSFPSDKVRSDAVDMEGLPYTPQNLTVVGNQSANKVDLNLRWTASYSPPGIKEYVIYRLRNRPPEVYQSREVTDESGQTSYVMGEAKEVIPQEIARTVSPNYIDSGLDLGDQCDYYVQAIDKKGAKSRISPRVSISVVGVIPPTAPRDLKVGDVQRQGENTEYVFPESNRFRNAVLGPEREVVLRWLPSTDNSKVVGYNVYRVQYGNSTASANPKPANSPVPNQIKVDPSSDAANRGMGRDAAGTSTKTDPVVPGNDRPLLGTTKDTTFVDKGLEFGSAYEYYVEAVDDDGNKVGDSVFVGTKKSTLAGCTITGAGDVDLDPVFAYYHNDYTLQVDNAVKSISLSTEKTDPQATVTVNGKRAEGDKFGPLALEPGENTFLIEVEPRSADTRYTVPETMSYSLKVTRTNTANPPVLTLPASATVLNEGSAYKAVGHIKFKDDLVWTGTVDYGDGTGAQALAVKADGSLSLEHTYLDNGKYKINVSFRYQDLGLIQGTVDVTVENVAPALISEGIQDEITVQEGILLTLAGNIADPGRDTWEIKAEIAGLAAALPVMIKDDKSFIIQHTFYDEKPVYDMKLTVRDDDGGSWSRNLKINVQNVKPEIQTGGAALVLRQAAFTRGGSFTDPGMDKWQGQVQYGDGSSAVWEPLKLNKDKTFPLRHTYSTAGDYTIKIKLLDNDGALGEASIPVKVKNYTFTLEAGEDISLKEGVIMMRSIPVQGRQDKIKSITVNYGDGNAEQPVNWSASSSGAEFQPAIRANNTGTTTTGDSSKKQSIIKDSGTNVKTGVVEKGWLLLQHKYMDNGTYTVKVKITDVDGDIYGDSFQVVAENVAPTLELGAIPDELFANGGFSGLGTITDPGADTWTVVIDYNDGSEPSILTVDSGKTFSFGHYYSNVGVYEIKAVVKDDDGGEGLTSQRAMVKDSIGPTAAVIPPGGGAPPAASSDATLHSLMCGGPLQQADPGYAGIGFTAECLNYTMAATMATTITATADAGAVMTYSSAGGPDIPLAQGTLTPAGGTINLPVTITVTAEDGVTIRQYTITSI